MADVIDANNQPAVSRFCDSQAQKTCLGVSSVRSFQIVSPPFSCGVAWLVNALLELDIKTTNAGFEPDHWNSHDDHWGLSAKALGHLKWHLPVLHERQRFFFPEQVEVFWEHRLDFARLGPCPTILFVRDPRDAVHSLFRRNYAENMEFLQYLKRPDEWPDHFPGLFQLPPFETFAYFCFFWMAMSDSMPVKMIRFEDAKQSPVKIMKEVLNFLQIERTDKQIEAAIASSSFENARQAMEKMEQATNQVFKTVRKGEIGEWEKVYSEAALAHTQGICELVLEQMECRPGQKYSNDSWLFSDYRLLVERKFPKRPREIALAWLLRVERGERISAREMVAAIEDEKIRGVELLQLAVVLEAIYYIQKIFADTTSTQSKAALNAFVNLNVSFFDQGSVRQAALSCLGRLEAIAEVSLVNKINWEHDRV